MNIKYDKKMFEYKEGGNLKKRLFVLFLFTVFIVLAAFGLNMFRGKVDSYKDPNASEYYAVFLNNDQVYFGKLENKTKDEIVISKVYYISVNENINVSEETSQPQFQLIKLGNELHGPTDRMFINRNQVLFYEQLRLDSRVVQSINSLES